MEICDSFIITSDKKSGFILKQKWTDSNEVVKLFHSFWNNIINNLLAFVS